MRLDKRLFTVNERVLLHLKESGSAGQSIDLPAPITQEGIAEALGILVNHVSRAVKTLQAQGLIREATARIKGDIRKRKIYLITEDGMAVANSVAKRIGDTTVSVRDSRQRTREMPASEAKPLLQPPRTYTALMARLDDRGVLDLHKAKMKRKNAKAVSRFVNAPAAEAFNGRVEELKALRAWLQTKKPPVMLITGHDGIGKTALAMQGVKSLEGGKHVFWYSFSPDSTHEDILGELSTFLKELGKPDMDFSEHKAMEGLRKNIEALLSDLDVLLVLDGDTPEDETLIEVVRVIAQASSAASNPVLITVTEPPRWRHELKKRALLGELHLEGLDKESCRRLAPALEEKEFEKVFKLTRGNPLEVRLLSEHAEDDEDVKGLSPEERALLRYLRLVHGQ